ncbi:MAG: TIGR02281 family clan AA aspartic protease [Rhodobacteraceae bacterium]|nr:TIGR02281 family clan AA aspartic protease [Paracoccaceae bacterium]
MDSFDTGRLIYLVLLVSVIAAYFLISHRDRLGQVARLGMLWGLIFIGVIAGFGLWQDIRDDVIPRQSYSAAEGRIEVPRAFDGHYYLTLLADGTAVQFVVDTGATDIVLSRQDAVRIGIDPDNLTYSGIANTANGTVRTARTRLDTLSLGPVTDLNVAVWINEGEMDGSLLGMAYLQRFDSLEISDGTLILVR